MKKIKQFFLNFFETQLLVTLIALPLLIGWGLGISLMTFAGNLLCTPLLMAMIMLSSLLFFTELLCIPNQILGTLFSLLTEWWDAWLQLGKKEWIITFAHPGVIPLALIPIATFCLLKQRFLSSAIRRIYSFSALFLLSFCGLWFYEKKIVPWHGPQLNTSTFKASVVDDNFITFTDYGFFASKQSVEKAVEFDLKPLLIKHFGNRGIKTLHIKKPGQRIFTGTQALCTHFKVAKVKLPFFNDQLNKRAWRAFFELKKYLKKEQITLQRSDNKSII